MNVLLISCIPLTTAAAEELGNDEGKHHGHRLERLGKELDLTDDQKTKIKELFKANKQKIKAIKEANREQLKETLTPEQKLKLEKLSQRRQELRKLKDNIKTNKLKLN